MPSRGGKRTGAGRKPSVEGGLGAVIQVRLPDALLQQLARRADDSKMTVSAWARAAIEKALDAATKKRNSAASRQRR